MAGDLIELMVTAVLSIALPWWIVRQDQARLPPDRLARTWNDASLGASVLAFGALCLPVHFIRGHGWLLGPLLASCWMGALGLVLGGPTLGYRLLGGGLGLVLHTGPRLLAAWRFRRSE